VLVIVDYGVGNLASIQNMLKRIGFQSLITSDINVIANADKLILPGVGSYDVCVNKLNESHLKPVLEQKVLIEKKPILGICVGMQLLFSASEEGIEKGFHWIKGTNVKFKKECMDSVQKIPHMGWTDVTMRKPSKLLKGLENESRFYFVHSYHAIVEDASDTLLEANYGYNFTAAVEKDNILGVQFHPEKSHRFGMKLFENFVNYF
jgi:imidazole glycerol-phosphate synthase subunit HisH